MSAAGTLLDQLRQLALLEPDQLARVEHSLAIRLPRARDLARELVLRGWLTAYQAGLLLQGRGRELVLGSYVVLDKIGEGGMGTVFKARHQMLGRLVALKLVRKEKLDNPNAVKRFRREIKAAAQLNHPNIVLAFDADQVGDIHFFTMEYVEGTDLGQLIKEHGPLPVDQACACIRQAALGLQHAFAQGLVHRDIKPSNLLLSAIGSRPSVLGPNAGGSAEPKADSRKPTAVVKILDMGLARLENSADGETSSTVTREGTVMGSLDYVAPEQAMDSHNVDIRADLYSLGCTFYHLLTGKVPFPGGTAMEKMFKHQFTEPPPVEQLRPEVPAGVAAVIRKLMAKKPEDRFQTPADLVAAIDHLANPAPTPPAARPAQPVYTPATGTPWVRPAAPASSVAQRPRQRQQTRLHWLLMLGSGAAALALLLAVLSYALFSGPTRKPSSAPAARPPSNLPDHYRNSLGMEFVLVPAGTFWMGGGGGQPGTQQVTIDYDYYLGIYEVTQARWQAVMGTNPSYFAPTGGGKDQVTGLAPADLARFPVESVSWEDCQEFIKRLNEQDKEPGWVYRLPTEAEWEYACRGAATSQVECSFDFYLDQPTNTLDPAKANVSESKAGRLVRIGTYPANRLGLYDMHGNVCEWCQNLSGGSSYRVDRGGSWLNTAASSTAAAPSSYPPAGRLNNLGLRLARVPAGR